MKLDAVIKEVRVQRFAAIIALVLLGASARGDRLGEEPVLIQHKGSDTLLHVAQSWAEKYQSVNRGVGVAVTGGGSGTGISSVINGTADIASASRNMKIEAARRNGSEPHEFMAGEMGTVPVSSPQLKPRLTGVARLRDHSSFTLEFSLEVPSKNIWTGFSVMKANVLL
jgi:phosphate transport system substrate-binding protein